MSDSKCTGKSVVVWVRPETYERILNHPDSIFIEAVGESPLKLKIIGGPRDLMEKLEAARNDKDETDNG